MRAHRTALLCLAAALIMASDGVFAQKMSGRGVSSNIGVSRPPTVPDGPRGGGGHPGGGHRGPGWGGGVPGIIVGLPQAYPRDRYVIDNGPPGPRQTQTSRRGASGAPPANERRLVPDEVINDPQLQANDIVVPLDGAGHVQSTISSPMQVHNVEKVPAKRAPELGEHNEEILQELGFDSKQIDGLLASGAVSGHR